MSYNLVQYRSKLRTDLKDSGSLWSDAELDRAVVRAYDDVSRFLPLEGIHEHTIDFEVSAESITTGEDTDVDQVVDGADISASVAGDTLTITAQPDKPRVLTFLITDANSSISDFVITVAGSDINDLGIEEAFVFSTGLSQTGKKVFKSVTSVTITSITGNGASDTCDIGVGSINNVWHYLTYKPIKPESETVTSSPAGTTYTRDTHYEMDNSNGAIRILSGGDMAAATAYLVTYTKSKLGFNLRSILPDYTNITRITRVQYPVDIVPQKFVSFGIWSDFLIVSSKQVGTSQEEMIDKEHVAFYFEGRQRPPTARYPGSLSDVMDEVVSIGSAAYALFTKAVQYQHQAVTDFASVRTLLGTTISHTKLGTALDAINTALDTCDTLHTKIATALDAMATNSGTVATYLTGASAPSTKKYLDDGDAFINLINVGDQVAQIYAIYAEKSSELAMTIERLVEEYGSESTKRLDEISARINEGAGYAREAELREGEIDRFTGEADRYLATAQSNLQLADRFMAAAMERRNEFWSILKDKAEYRRRVSSVALQQNP